MKRLNRSTITLLIALTLVLSACGDSTSQSVNIQAGDDTAGDVKKTPPKKNTPEVPWGEKDDDGDGVKNKDDQCPNLPEDKDGYQDKDGCPEQPTCGDKTCDKQQGETIGNCPKDCGVLHCYDNLATCDYRTGAGGQSCWSPKIKKDVFTVKSCNGPAGCDVFKINEECCYGTDDFTNPSSSDFKKCYSAAFVPK